MEYEINPARVNGARGLISKTISNVYEVVPDEKHPGYVKTGKYVFKGTDQECEEYIKKAQENQIDKARSALESIIKRMITNPQAENIGELAMELENDVLDRLNAEHGKMK